MASANACTRDNLAQEIESRLVRHYLSTNGPGGLSSLSHIDASKTELCEALGEGDSDVAVQLLLDSCGDPDVVGDFLSRGMASAGPKSEVPGFFRFLVLTCVVVASADDNRETHEFGSNLQRLFHTERTFGIRDGLPKMWRVLAKWSEARHVAGYPNRRVILPRYEERHRNIGLTNAISFPYWRDVLHLRSTFERQGGISQLRTPQDAARLICPIIRPERNFSHQMVTASAEFADLYRSEASLLAAHRFWPMVCRALDLRRPKLGLDRIAIRAELVLGSFIEEARIAFFRSPEHDGARGGAAVAECAVEMALSTLEAMQIADRTSASQLTDLLQGGSLPFIHERFGVWMSSLSSRIAEHEWLYLVRRDRLGAVRRLACAKDRPVDDDWYIVGPVRGNDARFVHQTLGLLGRSDDELEMVPFRLLGGVRTRAGLLGRPTLLPWVEREGRSELSMTSMSGASEVEIVGDGSRLLLAADESLDGAYEVTLLDRLSGGRTLAFQRTVRFAADAPEHPQVREPSLSWHDRLECRENAWQQAPVTATLARSASQGQDDAWTRSRFDDLLELIYARASSGWSEADLVGAIMELIPGPSPWDVLRTLQECEWLRPVASIRWRAMTWWLVKPHLVRVTLVDAEALMLRGSASAAIRKRFAASAKSHRGSVSDWPGVGPLSPTTSVAIGVEAESFARELGWPLALPRVAAPIPAPRCWPPPGDELGQHDLHQEWHWTSGRFLGLESVAPPSEVEVRWWRRERGDRADLYSVDGRSPTQLITPSRTLALVEAFRRARMPMLIAELDVLLRLPREGNLPLHLARSIHVSSLTASGLMLRPDGWRYGYAGTGHGIDLVRACLGKHFVQGTSTSPTRDVLTTFSSSTIGLARHRSPFSRALGFTD